MNPQSPYQSQAPIPPPSPDPYNQNGHNSGLSSEERNWGMAAHLSSFTAYVGVPLGHIVGPLVVWLIKKDQYPFVESCGKESINYGISMSIYYIISAILCFVLIGIPMVIALFIFDIIVTISAAMAASNGQQYRYPAIFRFIS
jgi:uncharacterized Tic20 family protein